MNKSEINHHCYSVVRRWASIHQWRFDTDLELNAALGRVGERLSEKHGPSHHFNPIKSVVGLIAPCDVCEKPRTNAKPFSVPMVKGHICAKCLASPPVEVAPQPVPDNPTFLYRYFDAASNLLYIGISDKPGQRMHQHMKDKDWISEMVRSEFETYGSREDALTAEAKAIRKERPKYNVAHNIMHSEQDNGSN